VRYEANTPKKRRVDGERGGWTERIPFDVEEGGANTELRLTDVIDRQTASARTHRT
jgi:hypothetical protein